MRRLACLAAVLVALGPATAQAPSPGGDERRIAALGKLEPQRTGAADAFVVVAALDSDPVFGREAREAGRVLARRFWRGRQNPVLAEDQGEDRADGAGTWPTSEWPWPAFPR